MPYSSPLHILESLDINPEEITSESIVRIRKKLLADFNLSGQVTIKIKNKEYTKDEILKTIDKLKEVDNLGFHLEIFKDKKILNWIEKPESSDFFKYDFIGFLKGKEDDVFFGDTIGKTLLEFVIQNTKKRNFKHLGDMLAIVNSLKISEIHHYSEILYRELEQIIEEFKNRLEVSNVPMDKKIYKFIIEPEWTDFLNNLPEGFEELRNEYCAVAINYTSVIYKHFNEFAYNINVMLLQTECDPNLENIIVGNQKVFEQNGDYSSSEGGGAWQYIKVFIWVAIILARVVACSSH